MLRLIPKYFVAAVIAMALVVVVFGLSNWANAQEITPTPGTYSYGSTSEFSPYVALSSSSNLAPTGDSPSLGYLAILVLGVTAGSLAILTYIFKKTD